MASVSWISPPTPGCVPVEGVEDLRREHVAAHHAPGSTGRRPARASRRCRGPARGGRRPARGGRSRRRRSPRAGTSMRAITERRAARRRPRSCRSARSSAVVHDVVAQHAPRRGCRPRACGRPTRRGRGRAARPGGRSGCRPGRRAARTSASRSSLPFSWRWCSSSKLRSKWSSRLRLPRPVMMRMSSMPGRTASSTTYWMAGLSTTGSISLGCALVAGRKRVPRPGGGDDGLAHGAHGQRSPRWPREPTGASSRRISRRCSRGGGRPRPGSLRR